MKKYIVVKVKVDKDRNVTAILDVLFESYDEKQAEKFTDKSLEIALK